ncbi:MAG: ABC transporter permease [Actinomycetes bacterium]
MALAISTARPLTVGRRIGSGALFLLLGALMIGVFALGRHAGVDATFRLSSQGGIQVPPLVVPARTTSLVLGALVVAAGLWQLLRGWDRRTTNWAIGLVVAALIFSLLTWGTAGESMSLVDLTGATLARSIPLVLGAMSGVLCERAGVINVNIEGQMLVGAFMTALVASVTSSLWFGLLGAAAGGALLALVLAFFAIRYLVDQVILGVVLNVFASGLTGFFFDRVLVPNQNSLNSPPTFAPIRIPGLASIPILGPIFFDQSFFFYLTVAVLVVLQIALFRSRWGLRVRAVGEHPVAADTMGINVLFIRYRNVVLGGVLAGLAGAYLTIGTVGAFGKDISSGKGFIALAALIFGRWTPIGALGAALIFGFADALQNILSILGAPIPSSFLLMAPYLATIFAVAGLVGKVRAPKADGKPYVKA